ncbi:MAG TPA: ATPase, T2SS/T4P/T4SS family [Candidatus Dormibacteraeota bacterium]|nr:ATPase, T2SS/T4P/T4SS family [Candidatus Dormibacteraeota bacterium]
MADTLTAPEDLLRSIRARLTLELDPAVANPFSTVPGRRGLIRDAIRRALADVEAALPHDALVDDLYDELVGLGPLQPLMSDPEITDILVNRHDEVFVERQGRLEITATRFRDQAHLEQVIAKIVALVGREISVDKPLVDARMVDGSRANAVYAPVGGPTLCIRKFNRLRLALLPDPARPDGDWVSRGGMSAEMARFLDAMARARATILVAGATGAGKSTLLRSIVDAFPLHERVITIEDTAELELENPHWVRLECVHHHELGGQDSSARRLDVADLVQNALRMRPDRLIIGEIRNSREAYHTLEALNTGHDGSATTIHASSAADALSRLELLVGRSFGQLTPREIRGYIARVIDVVAVVSRLPGGRRCVVEICELAGSDGAEYDLRPVFSTDVEHDGDEATPLFRTASGYRPARRLARKLALEGLLWIS